MPELLELPTELIEMIGHHLLSQDLCHFRLTCIQLARQLQPLAGSRITLPIDFDDAGIALVEAQATSTGRLSPIAPFIRKIRVIDQQVTRRMNVYYRTQPFRLCETAKGSSFEPNMNTVQPTYVYGFSAKYRGFHRGVSVRMIKPPAQLLPVRDGQRISRLVEALASLAPLHSARAVVKETFVDMISSQGAEQGDFREDDEVDLQRLSSAHWRDCDGVMNNRTSSEDMMHSMNIRSRPMREASDDDCSYHHTFIRPGYLDLTLLYSSPALPESHKMSRFLKRLELVIWPATMKCYPSGDEEANILSQPALTKFLQHCSAMKRLNIQFYGEEQPPVFNGWTLASALEGDALPRLDHLRVEGGYFMGDGLLSLVQSRSQALSYLYLAPWRVLNSMQAPSAVRRDLANSCLQSPKMRSCFLDLGYQHSASPTSWDNQGAFGWHKEGDRDKMIIYQEEYFRPGRYETCGLFNGHMSREMLEYAHEKGVEFSLHDFLERFDDVKWT